jgi:hypothetical protein
MALFFECMLACARNELDTADIVREACARNELDTADIVREAMLRQQSA